jgi:hypothetical protein
VLAEQLNKFPNAGFLALSSNGMEPKPEKSPPAPSALSLKAMADVLQTVASIQAFLAETIASVGQTPSQTPDRHAGDGINAPTGLSGTSRSRRSIVSDGSSAAMVSVNSGSGGVDKLPASASAGGAVIFPLDSARAILATDLNALARLSADISSRLGHAEQELQVSRDVAMSTEASLRHDNQLLMELVDNLLKSMRIPADFGVGMEKAKGSKDRSILQWNRSELFDRLDKDGDADAAENYALDVGEGDPTVTEVRSRHVRHRSRHRRDPERIAEVDQDSLDVLSASGPLPSPSPARKKKLSKKSQWIDDAAFLLHLLITLALLFASHCFPISVVPTSFPSKSKTGLEFTLF